MSNRKSLTLACAGAGLLSLAFLLLWTSHGFGGNGDEVPARDGSTPAVLTGATDESAAVAAEAAAAPARTALDDGTVAVTGVRGRVVDGRSGQPVAGVEVVALRRPPSLEHLWSRFAGLLRQGLWTQSAEPVEVLGRDATDDAGRFEIVGLPVGRVYLDGRSELTYVRTPRSVRLARGEVREGIELVGAPAGRVAGVVLAPDGRPAAGAEVSVRPGLNAFLGQITQRKYRWLEAETDDEGRFTVDGVPTGRGYTVAASHPLMAYEEVYGVDVAEGRTTHLTIEGHAGARLVGRVMDADGGAVEGAELGMVYMDVSRALFSADGRDEPLRSDADGRFSIPRVAAGRIAITAIKDGFAPAPIEELTVVDGGVYDELMLVLGSGRRFGGMVVDQDDTPLRGVAVTLRPLERPEDPDAIKMALKIRNVEAETGADGRFQAAGLTGDRLAIRAVKAGYVTELKLGVKIDDGEVRLRMLRGAVVRGKVAHDDGTPVTRFRVEARSRQSEDQGAERPRRRLPFGRRGWQGGERTIRMAEGRKIGDRALDGDWQDMSSEDGTFVLRGVPPGRIRVRVRAEGCLSPADQHVELAGGEQSEVLAFTVRQGLQVSGRVVDAGSGAPVADAQVTAHQGRGMRGRGPFRFDIDPEDFDFLGLSSNLGRHSSLTDSQGRFRIDGLAEGEYRFTARHPDLAKASVKDVELREGEPVHDLRIELDAGGAIEGTVTGAGNLPVRDAVVVALSLSAGSFKSSSTGASGHYRIEGLAPGQYVVFKSRMDERAFNLGYDLLGNMRLKTVTVRGGKTQQLDIHDADAGTVRVFGTVRDAGRPVARAMVSALTSDRDGILGMGIRAKPTDQAGRYELIGMKPGEYFFQVTRFQSRPQQAGLAVEVPEGVGELRVDLEVPQGSISGVVQDRAGNPVSGVRVSAGVEEGGVQATGGLLGLIVKNAVARGRTDAQGRFSLPNMSPGVYRLMASGRQRRGGDGPAYGDAVVGDLRLLRGTALDGVVVTLPVAGSIHGTVVDGNGAPVGGAEVTTDREDRARAERDLHDLFGLQLRPARTDGQGRFELSRVTPGTYRVRAEADGLAPGVAEDVVVVEGAPTEVSISILRGATLRVRVTNADGQQLPAARITVLDGRGKPLARNVSVLSVFRRIMRGRKSGSDSGWYEVGNVPPDTYTAVITEKGQPELRMTRTIKDGEHVAWEIDMAAELEARRRAAK